MAEAFFCQTNLGKDIYTQNISGFRSKCASLTNATRATGRWRVIYRWEINCSPFLAKAVETPWQVSLHSRHLFKMLYFKSNLSFRCSIDFYTESRRRPYHWIEPVAASKSQQHGASIDHLEREWGPNFDPTSRTIRQLIFARRRRRGMLSKQRPRESLTWQSTSRFTCDTKFN